MAKAWYQILLLALVLDHGSAGAEEAVTHEGRRLNGILQITAFLPSKTAKPIPLEQIHLVRFPEFPAPLPRCRLLHRLLFPGDQRLIGELLSLGPKDLQFRISTGDSLTLARGQLQGIVQPDNHVTLMLENFDGSMPLVPWSGKPIFDEEHAFSGKKSLLVDPTCPEIGLMIPPMPKNPGPQRATLFFYDPGTNKKLASKVQLAFQTEQNITTLTLFLGGETYEKDARFRLKASPGWHLLQMDWDAGEVKAFVDDFFLGSQAIPMEVRLASLRFFSLDAGRLWFDAFHLAGKVPPIKRTPGPPELDEIWLKSGEQVFGELLEADGRGIVLDARFGKRTFPWSKVRGIYFRTEGKAPSLGRAVDIRFRSGPGMSADQLTGELVGLNDRRLLLRHAVLGELAIARTRLDRIRFPEPKAK